MMKTYKITYSSKNIVTGLVQKSVQVYRERKHSDLVKFFMENWVNIATPENYVRTAFCEEEEVV